MFKKIVLFLLFCGCFTFLLAQSPNIGNLPIRNYSKKVYGGGTQSWDIAKDEKGILYFANNEGLLEFDGNYWRKYPISNKTIVRSLAIDNHKIYVGAQGELGYFEADESNNLVYHSLVDKIPEEYKKFADVWTVFVDNQAVFFRTERYVFYWKEDTMKVFNTGGPIHYIGKIGNEIYVHDEYKGLLKFNGNSFLLPKISNKPKSAVTSFLPYNQDTVLITTLNDGVYLFHGKELEPWGTSINDFLKEKGIYSSALLPSGDYALGIKTMGLLILDKNGNTIRMMGRTEGLQNVNINALEVDLSGNLWLALDNGIDYVETTSAFSYIYPDGNIEGTGYTAIIHNDLLYLGNSNGLYFINWKKSYSPFEVNKFKDIENTAGLAYGLHESNGELFLGHHEGAFEVKGTRVEKLSDLFGVWNYLRLDENHLLAGSYFGIFIYKKENNRWLQDKKVMGLDESSRILAKDKNGVIWMAHPYRGIYKVKLNKDFSTKEVKKYGAENGLPSDLFNHVFSIRGETVFAGETNVFSFDEKQEQFVPIESYNEVFRQFGRVKMLKDGIDGSVWFVAGETCGRVVIEEEGLDKKVEVQLYPELKEQLVGGFEFVYPFDEHNVFFGAEKGFIHFDTEKYNFQDTAFHVRIQEIVLVTEKDSVFFSGSGAINKKNIYSFSSKENSFRFQYSANYYRNPRGVEYQTKLEGLNNNWSDWSFKTEKEYNNLSYGTYTFFVRAKNEKGIIKETSGYTFEISPPWYFTRVAWFIYCVLLGLFLFTLIKGQRKRFEEEKLALENEMQKKEELYQKKVERGQLQISQMKAKQLETEVDFKNKELASVTLHLVQKREMIAGVKVQLTKLSKKASNDKVTSKDIDKLIRLVDYDSNNDEEWERFAHHFDSVHQNFLQRVKEAYPQLSPNDLKLCAYLKMNLSTKEIAPLMHISVRGVEASRYRLRKKMDLPADANLREIMMEM